MKFLGTISILTGVLFFSLTSSAYTTCRSSDSKYQGEDSGWAGSLRVTFNAIENGAMKNADISVDYDDSAGVTSPDSISYESITSEPGSGYAKSAAWKTSTAFPYALQNDAKFVLLMKFGADGAPEAQARVKPIGEGEEYQLNCEND